MSPAAKQPETGLVCLLGLLVGFMAFPSDPDLWFHLADGEWILAHGKVPQTDPFSFTRTDGLWVPHSWLFDVGCYVVWNLQGPRALEAGMACVYMLAIVSGFALLRRGGVQPMTAVLLCACVAIFAGNTRGVRPQVFSLLLTVHLLQLLSGQREQLSRAALLWLPAMFLLWAQLHAACVMGLVLLGAWTVGRTLELIWTREPLLRCATLWLALLASGTAVLLTPHVMTHYEYAVYTLRLNYLKTMVSEWQRPQLWPLASPDVFFYLGLGGVLVLVARRWRGLRAPEVLVAGGTWLLAATATRHIPLATVASLPLVARLLTTPVPLADAGPLRHSPQALAIGSVLSLGIVLGFWQQPEPVEARYAAVEPVRGAAALLRYAPLRVFTNYNTGAYVLHAGDGALLVSADSRADVYGDEVLQRVDCTLRGESWREAFAAWRVEAAVIDRRDPLSAVLQADPGWQLLAEDVEELTFVAGSVLERVRPAAAPVRR